VRVEYIYIYIYIYIYSTWALGDQTEDPLLADRRTGAFQHLPRPALLLPIL
jgi:hypothetical protein